MQSTRTVTKPSKQRRMLYRASDHVRHRFFASHLSPELRTSHLVKSFPVRSGDTVRIMRGDHKGFEGKVTRVDKRKYRIYVEGLTREKVDGTAIFVPIHPSKVMITNLSLDDKWRKKVLERKKLSQAKPKEARRKAKEEQMAKIEQPMEIIETKPVVREKRATRERRSERKALLSKEKASSEAIQVKEEPQEKKTPKAKRKTSKRAVREMTAEPKDSGKEKKSQTEKKKRKRKIIKKTEGGQ